MADINAVNGMLGPLGPRPAGGVADVGGKEAASDASFSKVLMDSISEVNRLQAEAADATNRLASGQSTNVAEVMVAVQKADVAFSMLMEIKNKLMDAYQEIQQMRI